MVRWRNSGKFECSGIDAVRLTRRSLLKYAAGAVAIAALPVGLSTRSAAAASDIQPGDTIEIVDGPLNLRAGPGLDYDVLFTYDEGVQLQVSDGPVDADGYTWVKVLPGDYAPAGWLAVEFVQVVDGGGTGIQPGDWIEVVDGPLNLRRGHGLDYAVLFTFNEGDRMQVSDGPVAADGYTWVEILDHDPAGWLAAEFVQVVDGDGSDQPRFEVTDGPLNVRSGAGLDAPIIDTVPTGAQGHATAPDSTPADGYTWALVEFDSGLPGWIALDFVTWL